MDEAAVAVLLGEARRFELAGRIPDAIAAYQRLLARWPERADSWYNLGVLQRKAREFAAALDSYRQALARGVSKPEEVHLNCSVIYADYLRRDDAAERELHAALSINPNYIPALMNLANLHEDLGRREAAAAVYQRILALDPKCFEALARYSNVHNFVTSQDPLIGRLRDALEQPGLNSSNRASLGFALGRALDACAAYNEAFDAYTRANRASRDSAATEVERYQPLVEQHRIDRLIAAFPNHLDAVPRRLKNPAPIFICGMFRSGSTLVEQLLIRHPAVASVGELDLIPHIAENLLAPFPESVLKLPAAQLQQLAARYIDTLSTLHPRVPYITDKRPDNFRYIGLIKRLFPDAKIVHTTRDALDNCLSIFFLHLDHRMSYASDLLDIGHYYREYRRLMAHWREIHGANILDVSYDDLVKEPKPAIERLLSFLGLEWDERCLAAAPAVGAVKTASVWQVREPIYTRSSGRARHYTEQLAALRDYLEKTLSQNA